MKQETLTQLEISDICRELSLLLHAGVSPGDGLALLAQEEQSPPLRQLLSDMAAQVDDGATLAAAMEKSGRFPTYAFGLASVGEYTGRLEEALGALARYYEERERMNRQLRSALTYPAILLLLMLVVIVVLLSQVLPVFNDVYASLGGQLTGVAGGLLVLGRALDAAMPVLCVLMAAVVLCVVAFSLSDSFRAKASALWRRHQGDRGISRKLHDAHTAQVLAMGLRSGLSPEEALKMASNLLQDTPEAAERCRTCLARLEAGDGLAEALRDTGVLPATACRLLSLGMRGGTGDSVMEEISRRLAEEADVALEAKVGRIEPTLVLVTSILVGAILLSVMLPLMHIMTAIG
jgi:type IV pilus assembly protein PilC